MGATWKYLGSKLLKCLHKALPLLLAFFLLTSVCQVSGLKQTVYYGNLASTVKAPSVTLGVGTKGSVSLSTTQDYANVAATSGYTFYENASAVPSTPLALDGSTSGSANAASVTTGTLATTKTKDVIYLMAALDSSTINVSSISNTGATLAWTQRGSATYSTDVRIETWYAISSTTFSGSITVSLSSSAECVVKVFGISGAKTPNPFDSNLHSPASGTGSGSSMSVSLTTLNSNDFIVGVLAANAAGTETITSGTGFTSIGSQVNMNPVNGAGEYKIVSAAQSSLSVSFSASITADWAMIADAVQAAAPSIVQNTAFFIQTLTGSFTVAPGSSAFLCSPASPSTTTVYPGSWVMDLWASATSAGTLSVTFSAVDSSNNIVASAATGSTGTIGTTKSEVKTSFAGSQVSIPSGGRLVANITNPAGSGVTFTIYWGPAQTTNFQTPADYDYVLALTNSASSAYSVSLSTYSSSTLSRTSKLDRLRVLAEHARDNRDQRRSDPVFRSNLDSSTQFNTLRKTLRDRQRVRQLKHCPAAQGSSDSQTLLQRRRESHPELGKSTVRRRFGVSALTRQHQVFPQCGLLYFQSEAYR